MADADYSKTSCREGVWWLVTERHPIVKGLMADYRKTCYSDKCLMAGYKKTSYSEGWLMLITVRYPTEKGSGGWLQEDIL